jgi:GNAT superfamily N-acetyltransferase
MLWLMRTRVANTGDFEAVLPMMRQHRLGRQESDRGLYELHPDAEARFRRWLGRMGEDPRSVVLVAEEDGLAIGFVTVTIESDLPIYHIDEFAMVREWWVEPAYHNRGVGEALIRHAIELLARSGLRQVRVRTAAADTVERAVLERCGFRAGCTEMVMGL